VAYNWHTIGPVGVSRVYGIAVVLVLALVLAAAAVF